jgi:hypothetical protein
VEFGGKELVELDTVGSTHIEAAHCIEEDTAVD